MKTAIITGVLGQDGYYITKLLISKGYRVVGVYRRTSHPTDWRLKELWAQFNKEEKSRFILEAGDITDLSSILRIIKQYKPNEVYNFAAQSQVWWSFKTPLSTAEITGLGALSVLEAVRQEAPECKFYQASSSEQFGNMAIGGKDKPLHNGGYEIILNEDSPMVARSPYGCAKLFAHGMTRNYREAYKMFAVGGILFNHESKYRGIEFVTRRVTDGIAKVLANKQDKLTLGNIESFRDWGHAEDYVNAAWLMLQQKDPKDYVIATNETHSVKQFLELSCLAAGINDFNSILKLDKSLLREAEVDILIGDSSLARKELNWKPKHSFLDLVYEMMEADLQRNNISKYLISKDKFLELAHERI